MPGLMYFNLKKHLLITSQKNSEHNNNSLWNMKWISIIIIYIIINGFPIKIFKF